MKSVDNISVIAFEAMLKASERAELPERRADHTRRHAFKDVQRMFKGFHRLFIGFSIGRSGQVKRLGASWLTSWQWRWLVLKDRRLAWFDGVLARNALKVFEKSSS